MLGTVLGPWDIAMSLVYDTLERTPEWETEEQMRGAARP